MRPRASGIPVSFSIRDSCFWSSSVSVNAMEWTLLPSLDMVVVFCDWRRGMGENGEGVVIGGYFLKTPGCSLRKEED